MIEHEYIGRSVKASHPDYPVLDELARMIAIATNPHCHFNGYELTEDPTGQITREPAIPEIERKALVEVLKGNMEKQLKYGRFADFINSQDFNLE